ncbi:MAG: hypothetical protein ACR2GR_10855 [Rhodothermales bacterium]
MPPDVMAFSISGFQPVKSWLDCRMKSGAGRTSSPLDEIRPHIWSFDEDLLDLLWVLEATLAHHARANDLLGRIVDGESFRANAFPQPTEEERKGPNGKPAPAQPIPLFEEDGNNRAAPQE